MMDKLKGLMGIVVNPSYTIYFKCMKTSCGYVNKDGWWVNGHEEYECHTPGSCAYSSCGCA